MSFAIATPHVAATDAGAAVLADGGNAVDATVAATAVLGVTYPHMCGIGGDLFLLHYDTSTTSVTCLNASGPAPLLASPRAYFERGFTSVPSRGPLAVTVPGAVDGWAKALARLGSRPISSLLEPAIAAAKGGVPVPPNLARWIVANARDLKQDARLASTFFSGVGTPLSAGDVLRQPALARSLERIADRGASEFYRGTLGVQISEAVEIAGGLLRERDLAEYSASWVPPIATTHRGLDVYTTPPNSQGVTALVMLRLLSSLGAHRMQPGSRDYIAAFVTAKRAAFRLRDRHLGDPAFKCTDWQALLDDRSLRREVDPGQPSETDFPPGGDTVYVCTVDSAGNACSAIHSIYYGFGACLVAGETGVLLHNRGHAFSLDHDTPTSLAPGKRPRHTLMASLALSRSGLRYVFGSMGAEGQPQFNVQVLDRLLAGAAPPDAVAAPRILHGRFALEDPPDTLRIEADMGSDVIRSLDQPRDTVEIVPSRSDVMGHAHAIARTRGQLTAGADPRSDGSAIVG